MIDSTPEGVWIDLSGLVLFLRPLRAFRSCPIPQGKSLRRAVARGVHPVESTSRPDRQLDQPRCFAIAKIVCALPFAAD